MKRRQRELGLYNILGLEKRHIAHVMSGRHCYCAAVVILGGILVGVGLSKLAFCWCSVRLSRICPSNLALR